jgi:hypothetical protein
MCRCSRGALWIFRDEYEDGDEDSDEPNVSSQWFDDDDDDDDDDDYSHGEDALTVEHVNTSFKVVQ